MNNDGYIDETEVFQTSDLSLAAALCCFGAKIDAVDHSNSARAVFHFHREKGLDGLVQSFFAHELQVDPLVYFNCLKEAKTRLYSVR